MTVDRDLVLLALGEFMLIIKRSLYIHVMEEKAMLVLIDNQRSSVEFRF